MHGMSSKLLVGGHEGRGNIVRKKECLSVYMQELNDIVVTNDTTATCLGKCLGGDDLPFVIGVVVSVSSHLLTLTANTAVLISQRVLFRMRVQEHFSVFVPNSDSVVVSQFYPIISMQCSALTRDIGPPWLLRSSSLPIRVSWKAGLMNVSPVPERISTAKCT